jgi:hypothetical protein
MALLGHEPADRRQAQRLRPRRRTRREAEDVVDAVADELGLDADSFAHEPARELAVHQHGVAGQV